MDLNINDNKIQITDAGVLIFLVSGGGLSSAQIYEEDGVSTLDLALQDTFYQVEAFSVNGESINCTPDFNESHITILQSGKYLVLCSAAISSAQKNEYDFHIQKNNGTTDFESISMHRTTSVANAVGQMSAAGILDLTATDTVELWVKRLDGGAVSKTITIETCSITVVNIGG